MKLYEILEETAARCPNPFDEAQLVKFLNRVLSDISFCASKEDAFCISAIKGRAIYPLPPFITARNIKAVTLCGNTYERKNLADEYRGHAYWFPVSGYIALYPTPSKTGQKISISFSDAAHFMTKEEIAERYPDNTSEQTQEAFLNQESPIDRENDELLMLGLFIILASSAEDVTLANNYILQFNEKKKQALAHSFLRRGKYPTTRAVR